MTMFDRLQRAWPRLLLGACAIAVAIVAIVAARVTEHAADRRVLTAAIERETGLRVGEIGALEPAFWPSPGFRARAVVVASRGFLSSAEIDALTVHLDLVELLLGRFRVAALTIAGARLHVDPSRAAAEESREAAVRAARRLDTLRLRDVDIVFDGSPTGLAPISVVRGEVHWRDADAPLSLSSDFVWRGHAARIALWAQRPIDLWNGRQSAVLARLRSGPLSADAQGEYVDGFGFRGHVVARSGDLAALRRLGLPLAPLPSGIARAAVDAELAWSRHGASFSNAALKLDEGAFEGSFSLREDDGRSYLSATLATGDLDLAPWIAAAPTILRPNADGEMAWSQAPIAWSDANTTDFDLRVSARRLRAAPVELADAAFAVFMKRGRLEMSISEATGYGASARGRVSVTPDAAGLEAKGSFQIAGLDMSRLPRRAGTPARLHGILAGQIAFETKGATPLALAASLDGRLNATLTKGEIAGLDLEHAVRRPARGAPVIVRAGVARTSFDELTLSARALAGAGILDDARLRGPGVVATARGGVDLARLSGSARIETRPARGAPTSARPVVFYIGGPLFGLRVLPDPLAPRPAPPSPAFAAPPGLAPGAPAK